MIENRNTVQQQFSQIRELRKDMLRHEKAVVIFRFTYNNKHSFIALCLFTDEELNKAENKYYMLKIRIMDCKNLSRYIEGKINTYRTSFEYNQITSFFHLSSDHIHPFWFREFVQKLSAHISNHVSVNTAQEIKQAEIYNIALNDSHDPNRIYPIRIMRNGVMNGAQKHRTPYNAQLAQCFCPNLYNIFKDDKTISFVFSCNPEDELTEEKILENYIKNNGSKNITQLHL